MDLNSKRFQIPKVSYPFSPSKIFKISIKIESIKNIHKIENKKAKKAKIS